MTWMDIHLFLHFRILSVMVYQSIFIFLEKINNYCNWWGLSIIKLLKSKWAHFNSSSMAMSTSTFSGGFCEIFLVQLYIPILREKKRWLLLLLAEISNGKKKKRISWNFSMKFRSQIKNQVSNCRLLRASRFFQIQTHVQKFHDCTASRILFVCNEHQFNFIWKLINWQS